MNKFYCLKDVRKNEKIEQETRFDINDKQKIDFSSREE